MQYILILVFSFSIQFLFAQDVLLNANIKKAKQTELQRFENNIKKAFALPIVDSTLLYYETAFWNMMVIEKAPVAYLPKLKNALLNFTKYDNAFQNSLLEVIYSQYPKELEKEIAVLICDTSITPKQFAVCGEYLIKYKTSNKNLVENILKKRQGNFTVQEPNYYYFGIYSKKNNYTIEDKKTVLQSILKNEFLSKNNLIISLQNKNRNYPGIVLIRDSLGKILLLNDTIFYTNQLARSVTNLPYYISNGNTPQGIFRINGFGFSKNTQIGPTENFQLCMPNECKVNDFYNYKVTDSMWSGYLDYAFLPQQFQRNLKYGFLYESIFAGKLGRNEIISHGTTINNEYYKGKSYYGFTPTAGCLQAKEVWDYNTGKLIFSDQQKLIDAYKSIGANKGYLIVLDIIDANRSVNINDFKAFLK